MMTTISPMTEVEPTSVKFCILLLA